MRELLIFDYFIYIPLSALLPNFMGPLVVIDFLYFFFFLGEKFVLFYLLIGYVRSSLVM